MKKKNFIAGIVALLYTVSALGITVFADSVSGTYVDSVNGYSLNYTLNTDTKTAEITGFATSPIEAVALVIPEKIENGSEEYSVTSIANLAFGVTSGSLNTVASVDFPASITSIGNHAFSRQASLTTVSTNGTEGAFPEGLLKLGNGAFASNNKLSGNIVLPNSLTNIEGSVFYDVREISSITLGNAVESIGSFAFYKAYKVTEMELPETLTTLDLSAFDRMSALSTITVKSTNPIDLKISLSSETTTGIKGWNSTRTGTADGGNMGGAVTRTDGTVGYTNFVFDDISVLKAFAAECCVNANGFKDEASKKYFVTNNFKYNGSGIFNAGGFKCEGVGAIYEGTVTESETTTAVISLTTTVKGLSAEATSAYEIDFSQPIEDEKGNRYFVSKIADGEETTGVFENDQYITKLRTGDKMTSIGSRAFFGCNSLKEVIIDEGLLSLGKATFSDCAYLTKVSIPSTVSSWNDSAFKSCRRLTDLTFAEGLKTIGNEFYSCEGLENIVIPASVEKLSYQVLNQNYIKNIVIKGTSFPDAYDTSSLTVKSTTVFYVKNDAVKNTVTEKCSGAEVKLLSDYDAVADYFQWVGRGYTKGFVYAEQPIDATYYFVQYNNEEHADAPIKQVFHKDVKLNAGEYTTFDVETDKTESADVYIFLLDKNTLKPHIDKTGFTLTAR